MTLLPRSFRFLFCRESIMYSYSYLHRSSVLACMCERGKPQGRFTSARREAGLESFSSKKDMQHAKVEACAEHRLSFGLSMACLYFSQNSSVLHVCQGNSAWPRRKNIKGATLAIPTCDLAPPRNTENKTHHPPSYTPSRLYRRIGS